VHCVTPAVHCITPAVHCITPAALKVCAAMPMLVG
jgi:hypothetical protein